MKWQIVAIGLLAAVLAGCDMAEDSAPLGPSVGWANQDFGDTAIRNAIIRQATVFPVHFEEGTATLTSLGAHDLEVLADYYRQSPGQLNVRRGGVDEKLYAARVQTVLQTLGRAGVDTKRVQVVSQPPSGDGIRSESVVTIGKEAAGTGAAGSSPAVPVSKPRM